MMRAFLKINRLIITAILAGCLLKAAFVAEADEIILKNGKRLLGTIVDADEGSLRLESADKKVTFTVSKEEIERIEAPKPHVMTLADNDFFFGNYQAAYDKYLKIIDTYGGFGWGQTAYLRAAACLYNMGEVRKSILMHENFIDTYPEADNINEVKLSLAEIYIEKKQWPDAIEVYNELSATDDDAYKAEVYFRLGEAHLASGDYEQALESFLRVVVLYHDQSQWVIEAKYRSAECFERLGMQERARKTYKELIDEFPESDFAPKAKIKLEQLQNKENA